LALCKQWIIASGTSKQKDVAIPISLSQFGIVVGMDGSDYNINYAAALSSLSTLTVKTDATGDWGFRCMIIGI
jgi:hypothetical protein